jgi:hypothetical protein
MYSPGILTAKQAIRQWLNRYPRGIDGFDRVLVLSALRPDCLGEHGKFAGLPGELIDWALNQHGRAHLSDQHCLLNHTF